jgi:hypothetical protein
MHGQNKGLGRVLIPPPSLSLTNSNGTNLTVPQVWVSGSEFQSSGLGLPFSLAPAGAQLPECVPKVNPPMHFFDWEVNRKSYEYFRCDPKSEQQVRNRHWQAVNRKQCHHPNR